MTPRTPRAPRLLRPLAVLLAAVLLLAGCADGDDAQATIPEGEWIATGLPVPFTQVDTVTLTVDGDQVSIQGTCNTLSGTADWGETLEVDELGATEMGCPPMGKRQDLWLGELLSGSPTWQLEDDVLTLTRGEDVVEFRPRSEVRPDVDLESQGWVLTSVVRGADDDAVVTSVPQNVRATLVIRDGDVRISDGCNSGSGPVTVTGDTLELGDVVLTQRGCLGEARSISEMVDRVLFAGPATWSISADQLTLTGEQLDLSLVYTAAQ